LGLHYEKISEPAEIIKVEYARKLNDVGVCQRVKRRYYLEWQLVRFIEHGSEILFQPLTKQYIRSICGILKDTTSATAELLIEHKKDREREQAMCGRLR
jgi:hypothetical protein